jgi:hypothetical protein
MLASARHPHAAHARACRVGRASSTRVAAASRVRTKGTPERSASARVQVDGGAVIIFEGELVFDGVAISDASATVRRPFAARAGRALRLRACGGPAPDRCRVQGGGGAVDMEGGAVTFRGSSTIERTRAVRLAFFERTRAGTHLGY